MKSNRITLLIIFILVFLFSMALFIFFGLLFFYFSYKTKESENPNVLQKYTEFSPFSNSTHSGFVKLNRKLSSEEYVSYTNPNTGSLFILSNFGGSEYECTGSCFCTKSKNKEEQSNRRFSSSSSILSLNKGLFIILSSITASLAIKIANEAFHNECVQKYSRFCEAENIRSDVEGCLLAESEKGDDDHNSVLYDWDDADEKVESRMYKCHGHCVNNDLFDRSVLSGKVYHGVREEERCGKYEMSNIIYCGVDKSTSEEQIRQAAEREFLSIHLHQYCITISRKIFVELALGGDFEDQREDRIEQEEDRLLNFFKEKKGEKESEEEFLTKVYPCLGDKVLVHEGDIISRSESNIENVNCVKML